MLVSKEYKKYLKIEAKKPEIDEDKVKQETLFVAAGAHAISLINTLAGMAVDVEKRAPKLANVSGGLSGPAIKPVALHMVYQAVHAVDIPVIGLGGIMDYRDALEFLIAGASAVQVGTASFVNPKAVEEIVTGIEKYCKENNIRHISELIGSLEIGQNR